jgi:hypothetical protein
MYRILFVALAACTAAPSSPSIDAVFVRDPTCGPNASDDCFELVDGAIVLPAEPFELVVHGDELGEVTLRVNGAVVDAIETDRAVTPAGTDVTLLVSAQLRGDVELSSSSAAMSFEALASHATPDYGSTYSSNCYCLSCSLYCSINGKTDKAGLCC